HIDIDTGQHLVERVGDTLDAAIILAKEPSPSFHSVRLDHNQVYAIASRQLAAELGPSPDPAVLANQTFLMHHDLPESFGAWTKALGLNGFQPAAIDHFDSGQLILEAAAQGLGIAIMHADHLQRAQDDRLARVFEVDIESPYSYWFICRPRELENRPVRVFHDWVMKAGL
ncbi:MAG: LysR substrate-binding domain-containing protein, partial [Novosphingobium sp.]